MEQESEGQVLAKMRILEFERRVRMEALSGCQQIKNVENHIRDAPEGGLLGVTTDGEDAKALRTTILNASATIVEKFSKVIRLLSSAPPANASRSPNLTSTSGFKAQELLAAKAGALSLDADSPLLSPEESNALGLMQMSSPNSSACHTPLSGNGMSEGSPGRPNSNHVALDSDDDIGAKPARSRRSHDASGPADPELSEKPALPKKRKYLPKFQMKQRAIGTGDPANDGPPDDGYTWRKYGQKDIKESAYPRSYYRCTHKTDLGCPSIKMVQRSDEDPNYYDVTYRGHHICPSVEERTWHFGLAPSHIAIHELLSSEPKGPSSAFVMGGGTLQLGTPGQSHQDNVSFVGTGHGPSPPFSAPKSTNGLIVPPSISNKKSSSAANSTTTTSTNSPNATSPELNQIVATVYKPSLPSVKQEPKAAAKVAGNPVARDSLFGPGSNLLNFLLGRSDGVAMEFDLDQKEQDQHQQRETTANQGEIERTRDDVRAQSSPNGVSMANAVAAAAASQASAEECLERWAESGMLTSFQSERPPAGEEISRYTPSPARSEVVMSHAQQTRPTAATSVSYSNSTLSHLGVPDMDMYNIPTMETGALEVTSPASSSPFTLGMQTYIMDSPGSHQHLYMDYEFRTAMYYDSSQID